jgi:hypothetical protein
MTSARAWPLPVLPGAEPHPPPEPWVQFDPLGIAVTVPEVVEPSRDLPFQGLDANVRTPPVAPVGNLPDLRLAPLDGGLRPVQLATSPLAAELGARA